MHKTLLHAEVPVSKYQVQTEANDGFKLKRAALCKM